MYSCFFGASVRLFPEGPCSKVSGYTAIHPRVCPIGRMLNSSNHLRSGLRQNLNSTLSIRIASLSVSFALQLKGESYTPFHETVSSCFPSSPLVLWPSSSVSCRQNFSLRKKASSSPTMNSYASPSPPRAMRRLNSNTSLSPNPSPKSSKLDATSMPCMRDIPQSSNAPFGNTVFQVGTPPRKDASTETRLPPANLFQFGFGNKSMLPDIVQVGDPVLHEPAAEVPLQDIGSPEVEKVINDMVAVMRSAPGVGLAATQIGVAQRIIVLEDTTVLMAYSPPEENQAQQREPFDLLVIINPRLRLIGDATARFFEGCLSVNGYRAMVERHLEVEVTGYGRDGQPISVHATGWKARILQHECDHVNGVIYVERMLPRTFRTSDNLRLPLPSGCPRTGVVGAVSENSLNEDEDVVMSP
eukprot:TRINITY_DN923_c0_g1_i2.p1 TRINITY_DN923_c0_g1~~TRINITY_DN923_c0_g1_i2.p1  ORF type:complete len:414 (+),score=35.19 TRINITY_DN923_c0_g1_i2:105-1346(+)